MIQSSRGGRPPRRMLVAAAAALIPFLAGCGIGQNAQTQQWHQPTDGSTAAAAGGAIMISDAFVLGAPPNSTLTAGQNAGIFFAIYNAGPADQLVKISASGTAAQVRLLGGPVRLRSQNLVLLTGPRPAVVLTRLTRSLPGGSIVTISLTFQKAGRVTMQVPVMPRAQYYQTFSPAPPTSHSASASRSATRPAKGRPHPTVSGSATPSASPSPAG